MTGNKIWFRRKSYGWGWVPVTCEGWLTTGLYILFITLYFWRVDTGKLEARDVINSFVPITVISTALLIAICYRFGEKPEWRWGGKKIKPPFSRWLR